MLQRPTRRPALLRAAVLTLLAWAAASPAAAQSPETPPPGVLLRQGEWLAEMGAYQLPEALSLPTRRWPMAGWGVLRINPEAATLTVSTLSPAGARQRLQPITEQVERGRQTDAPVDGQKAPPPPPDTEDERYVRVPGLVWQPGPVALHRFRNGTVELVPEIGRRIELSLAGQPFAFTVQNGFRTADGRAYGSGAQLRVEVAGQQFDYNLGGYGWDVRILALGDFDRDGRPDFLFSIGGPNSSSEALVLSSVAKPGRNAPTAYLTANGC